MVWMSGCSLGEKRTQVVRQYILEYSSPTVEGLAQTKELIKVERFSVTQAFNTTAMLYQDSPYTLNSDPYNRWRVTPGEMVPDYLIRDLRKMNFFRAVYSYHDFANTRYVLQGQVEDFLEVAERGSAKAVLGMNVTLLDLAKEAPRKVLFQKSYRSEDPLHEKTAPGFAQAMSRAMEKISRQLMVDLREAIR
jgi:ABC-type uncharacterized transport system auxiliary subunit